MAYRRKRAATKSKRTQSTIRSRNGPTPAKKSRASKKEPVREVTNGSNDNETYVVESVSGIAIGDYGGPGDVSFLIRWKGYNPSESTWEPLENLNDRSIIKRFQPLIDKIESFKETASTGKAANRKKGRRGRGKRKIQVNPDEEFEVEDVLGIWYDHEDDVIRYKIKWKDYPLSKCTWEKQENLTQCEDLISSISSVVDYFEQHYTRPPKSKGKAKPAKKGRKAAPRTKQVQKKQQEEDEDEDEEENEEELENDKQEQNNEDDGDETDY